MYKIKNEGKIVSSQCRYCFGDLDNNKVCQNEDCKNYKDKNTKRIILEMTRK